MKFDFTKYQGTGNDFIMIDGRGKSIEFSSEEISHICDRRFGIGADGLIILKDHPNLDFEMDYYNADGSQSFCGNGSRCAQAFAKELGLISKDSNFLAIDGEHQGKIDQGVYATKMADVDSNSIVQLGTDWFIHTGSPHYIQFVDDVDSIDVYLKGREIRYSEEYREEGTNVNFVEIHENGINVRTYERGVENETLSCGTGVTAAAIAFQMQNNLQDENVQVSTKGGDLNILLQRSADKTFDSIWLVGPAIKVFEGSFE